MLLVWEHCSVGSRCCAQGRHSWSQGYTWQALWQLCLLLKRWKVQRSPRSTAMTRGPIFIHGNSSKWADIYSSRWIDVKWEELVMAVGNDPLHLHMGYCRATNTWQVWSFLKSGATCLLLAHSKQELMWNSSAIAETELKLFISTGNILYTLRLTAGHEWAIRSTYVLTCCHQQPRSCLFAGNASWSIGIFWELQM